MAINLIASVATTSGNVKEVIYTVYFSGTYTLNGTGDNIDFTASINPDGSLRNPNFLPGAQGLSRQPLFWGENGGDMAGAYIEIVKGAAINNWKAKFFQANGTELATGANYPAGAPGNAAASSQQIYIGGNAGAF